MKLPKLQQILVLQRLIKCCGNFLTCWHGLLMSTLSLFDGISCKFIHLLCKRWFNFRTASLLFLFVNIDDPLFSINSILHSIVCNYFYVTVFLPHAFFKPHLTHLIIITYTPPHQGMTSHIKFHLVFFRQTICCVVSDIRLVPLLLNADDCVILHLKNLDKPLI